MINRFQQEFGKPLSVHLVAYKVLATWIAIALWYIFRDYLHDALLQDPYTIQNQFFPWPFDNTRFALLVFVGMFVLTLGVIVSERRSLLAIYPAWLLVSSFLLQIHQQGFAIQTFVTTFWAGIPLLWLQRANSNDTEAQAGISKVLKLCISLVFLGALLGKLNIQYWSGEVFAHLHMPRFSTSPQLVSLFAKAAVLAEGAIVLCYFVPSRFSFLISGTLMGGMWLVTDYTIVNAVGPLLAVALAGILLEYRQLHLAINTKGRLLVLCAVVGLAVWHLEPLHKLAFGLLRDILA